MPFSSHPSPESTHSATPAEAEAHRTSEILSEAIMASVSSVRDSLPKEHHKHFETLRQEIIDFAKARGIPREALAKPDLLRKAAEKLPTPDLERLALLLERFEHLIVKKEPWTNKEALEYGEKYYHLEKQYTAQVTLLEKSGILKEGAILGIDDKKYPIPTLEQIASRLFESRETLRTKHDQGFTKLLLVPFGMSLDTLRDTLKQFLLSYNQSHPTFELNTDNPLWTWDEYPGADIGDPPNLVYYPQSFTEEGHGGKTKMQILEGQGDPAPTYGRGSLAHPFPGWTIHLLQPSNLNTQDTGTPKGFAPIPREGQGTPQGNENPRPPLEANKTPNEYLSILQKAQDDEDSPYRGESGMTPEDWITAFMIHLTEIGEPMDNWQNGKESVSYLTGAFFRSSTVVPCAYWYRDLRRVVFNRVGPRDRVGGIGVRSSVVV